MLGYGAVAGNLMVVMMSVHGKLVLTMCVKRASLPFRFEVDALDFLRLKHLRLATVQPLTSLKCYSTEITGEPPASRMTSAISSAKTRAPLAVSGATKLTRSVDTEHVSLVREDVILRQT